MANGSMGGMWAGVPMAAIQAAGAAAGTAAAQAPAPAPAPVTAPAPAAPAGGSMGGLWAGYTVPQIQAAGAAAGTAAAQAPPPAEQDEVDKIIEELLRERTPISLTPPPFEEWPQGMVPRLIFDSITGEPTGYQYEMDALEYNRMAEIMGKREPPLVPRPTVPPKEGYDWQWDGNQWVEVPIDQTEDWKKQIAERELALMEAQQGVQPMSEWQQAQYQLLMAETEHERELAQRSLEQQMWQRGMTEEQFAWEQQLAQMPYEGMTSYQQSQQEFARQQLEAQMAVAQMPYEGMTAYQEAQTQQQQQNYLAQLAAQPKSWLEYSAAAGTTPAIQPWMLPLMPQQYGGMPAGAPMPGWGGQPAAMLGEPTAGAPGTGEQAPPAYYRPPAVAVEGLTPPPVPPGVPPQGMQNLPALTQPSRQYQARMGPTAQQQYMGYEQARTGAPLQEQQFRLWSAAPPSGRNRQLSYAR